MEELKESNHSEHYQEITQNPLAKRIILKSSSTATSIMVKSNCVVLNFECYKQISWTHSQQETVSVLYKVEFGIGAKVNGQEQFREAYRGPNNTCIINDLRPK